MGKLRVTLDTNILAPTELHSIEEAARGLAIEFAYVTVSARELEGSSISPPCGPDVVFETGAWDESRWGECVWGGPVGETFVLDESRLDEGVLGADDTLFESILRIISNGSFPPPGTRDNLTEGERRQLRDAMILEAHWREGRDILITNDAKAFIGKDGSRREELEGLCSTRIMNAREFQAFCDNLRAKQGA
ncbi:MAG: hypothetical protein ACYC5J_02155 [Chloroflexota bacterium]